MTYKELYSMFPDYVILMTRLYMYESKDRCAKVLSYLMDYKITQRKDGTLICAGPNKQKMVDVLKAHHINYLISEFGEITMKESFEDNGFKTYLRLSEQKNNQIMNQVQSDDNCSDKASIMSDLKKKIVLIPDWLQVGEKVYHDKYGVGVVISNTDERIHVQFPDVDPKIFVLKDVINVGFLKTACNLGGNNDDAANVLCVNQSVEEDIVAASDIIDRHTNKYSAEIVYEDLLIEKPTQDESKDPIEFSGFDFFEYSAEYLEAERKRKEKRELRKAGPPKETEEQIKEKESIYDFLVRDRGVIFLVHFTPVTNIKSILENGLLPRAELEERGIVADTPDLVRLDSCLDYTSLSVSFPNYRILYQKTCHSGFNFAVLLLDPKLILAKPLEDISYLTENAAAKGNGNIEEKIGLRAAKALFDDTVIISGNEVTRTQLGIPDKFTTNPQAEVFVWGRIDPTFIKSILVRNEQDKKTIQQEYTAPFSDIIKLISINSWPFKPRDDYEFWKSTSSIINEEYE